MTGGKTLFSAELMSPHRPKLALSKTLGDKEREGGYKNWKFEVMSFMDSPLILSCTLSQFLTANIQLKSEKEGIFSSH